MVGFADGVDEGDSEGGIVCPGKRVGLLEGMAVGWFEGKRLGPDVGLTLGKAEG